MIKVLTLLILVSTSYLGYSQHIISKNFNSEELGVERSIKIYVPDSYQTDSTKVYPLTVVLDAEYLFDVYVGNAILFAKKDKAPEQIIVGINQNQYDERYRDCAYQKENSLPTAESESFYRFVRGELLDYMDENYRISPFKTVVGNTLTANFINYFFIEDYPAFSAFVNINPYYALDLPNLITNKAANLKDETIYYYLSNGSYNSSKREHFITTASKQIKSVSNDKFNIKYDYFSHSTKTASIGQSIPNALAFIFELYSAISKEEFNTKIKDLSPPDAIAYLENKYVEIEYLFGCNLKIRKQDIFAIEPIILDKENGDYLKDFGEMINKMFKESAIGDYYIGRYYETGGKLKQALKYYKSGYMKLPEDDPNADGYYENIERVNQKRDGTYIEQQ
ncbi:MAG: alpha/beta hydrolase [Lutibacter sp.]